jgi:hypothetical protein
MKNRNSITAAFNGADNRRSHMKPQPNPKDLLAVARFQLAQAGGKARAKKLTAKQRSESASIAAKARHLKSKKS